MIDVIKQVQKELPYLVTLDGWNTLDITYEPPHVERVWRQWDDYRIYLHRIYPCDEGKALWHPHPWPSVIYIDKGSYEMGIANGHEYMDEWAIREPDPPEYIDPDVNELACKLILPAGTYYEMTDPKGWHYVRPLELVMSIMVTGKPWANLQIPKPKISQHVPQSLTETIKQEILDYYK